MINTTRRNKNDKQCHPISLKSEWNFQKGRQSLYITNWEKKKYTGPTISRMLFQIYWTSLYTFLSNGLSTDQNGSTANDLKYFSPFRAVFDKYFCRYRRREKVHFGLDQSWRSCVWLNLVLMRGRLDSYLFTSTFGWCIQIIYSDTVYIYTHTYKNITNKKILYEHKYISLFSSRYTL